MTYDYEAHCVAATTEQGLNPIIEGLADAGVDYTVEQTGGMVMVLTVPSLHGTYGVTHDGEDPDAPYLICFYPGTSLQDGEGESTDNFYGLTTDEAIDMLRQAPKPKWER